MRRRQVPTPWASQISWNVPGLNTFVLPRIDHEIDPDWGVPILRPSVFIPNALMPWNEKAQRKNENCFHFFVEDRFLNGVWTKASRTPDRAHPEIERCGAALTPDFSVFTDWPHSINIWNIYRSRVLGAWWQQCGIEVIPTLQGGHLTPYSFAGIPQTGYVAISTGQLHSSEEKEEYKDFILEFLKRRPRCDGLLVYGQGLKPWLDDHSPVIKRYDHRLTSIRKQRDSIRKNL